MKVRISVPLTLSFALLTASAVQAQTLFSDFPVNGLISAFQVNGGYSVSDSFTLAAGGTVGELTFGAWLTPGDSVTSVTWSIGTTAFDVSLGSGVASAVSTYDFSNPDGFAVDTVTFAVPGVTLPAGTYYLTLSAAVSAQAKPVYWDINDAAGIDAWDSTYGHVSASNTCFTTVGISGSCAESFQLLSTNTSVSALPASISFANQTANTTSAAQAITLTNTGASAATISGIAVSGTNPGDFAQTNNCPISPATLAASGSCTINVTFTPLAASAFSAAISVTGSSVLSIGLSGTGTQPPPTVTLSPASITFPNQTVNTTSGTQSITLTNSGPGVLTVSSIAVTGTNPGDFAQTNNCPVSPATIAASGTCTISVTFTPAAASARSAAITITDTGAGSPQSAGLTGTGTPVPPAVSLAPSSLTFTSQTVMTSSSAQSITLTNSGPNPLTISGISVSGTNPGDFAQTNNCPVSPATLAVSSLCTISVTFTPQAVGARSASVTIADNGAGSPQSVSLSGTGATVMSTTWPNGYTYQATFTVAAGKVSTAQTNFPTLISGTYADFATVANGGRVNNTCTQTLGNNATPVPCDLIFTSDAAGTVLLNWEFETWTPSTGAVNIWVNVPNLSSGTVVYAWYGQSSVTTLQTTPSATWSSNFMAVYHLKENPAGTAPQLNDSTAHANNATMNGPALASQQQAGEIDGSVGFTGTTWATLANPANFSFERTDSFSLSGWFKAAANTGGALLSKMPATVTTGWAMVEEPGSKTPVFGLMLAGTGGTAYAQTPAVTLNTWHYVVVTYSGTSSIAGMNIYVDGVNEPLTSVSNNLTTSILNGLTPQINGRSGANVLTSDTMDEIRVSAKGVVLPSTWVTASYNNQSQPGTFFTVVTGLIN